MIGRASVFVLAATFMLCGCAQLSTRSAERSNSNDRTTTASNREDEKPSSYASAVAKLSDACPLMPADFVQRLAPGAYEPSSERYPLQCTVRNDVMALQISFDTGPDDPVNGAESISGLAKAAYLERLDPHSRGDINLTVILGKDENGTNHNLHVEVAGHDGRDHKDDALGIARAVLAKLNK